MTRRAHCPPQPKPIDRNYGSPATAPLTLAPRQFDRSIYYQTMKTTKRMVGLVMVWVAMSNIACFAQKRPDVAANEMVIRKYYAAYEKKDWHMLEAILVTDSLSPAPG